MFFFLAQTEQGDIFKITLETDEDMVCLLVIFKEQVFVQLHSYQAVNFKSFLLNIICKHLVYSWNKLRNVSVILEVMIKVFVNSFI